MAAEAKAGLGSKDSPAFLLQNGPKTTQNRYFQALGPPEASGRDRLTRFLEKGLKSGSSRVSLSLWGELPVARPPPKQNQGHSRVGRGRDRGHSGLPRDFGRASCAPRPREDDQGEGVRYRCRDTNGGWPRANRGVQGRGGRGFANSQKGRRHTSLLFHVLAFVLS